MARPNQRKVLLQRQPGATTRKKMLLGNGAPMPGSIYSVLRDTPTARICIIRSVGGIGDVLMTLPAVRQLKKEFPDCHITYATDFHTTDCYRELVKNLAFINKVVDARYVVRSQYAAVVDITSVCIRYEHSGLSPLNRIDIFSRACGIPYLEDPIPSYIPEEHELAFARNIIRPLRNAGKKIVFLHTASFDPKRCWPVENHIGLIKAAPSDIQFLISDFNNVLKDKHTYPNCTVVTNPNIRLIAALINESDLFVGPDSGPMHLAGALKKKALVMFGSIPPNARINHYKTHSVLMAGPRLPCMHCWYAKCSINYKCMKEITWEQVLNKIRANL